jgi:hypothetical protein
MAGKQAASPMTKTLSKKTSQDSSPARLLRFAKLPTVEDVVSTTVNHNIASQVLEDLSESQLALVRSPYERLFGQDRNDKKAFHDNLTLILMYAGKWIHNTTQLAQDQLKQIKEAPPIAPVITTAMWTKINRYLFRQENDKLQMLSPEERLKFRIINARLSFTKPNVVADVQRIQQSKIPGTNMPPEPGEER